MQILQDKKKKYDVVALCDVPAGFVFKFFNDDTVLFKLSNDCGYCELGGTWDSVETLDREKVNTNIEQVKVYGKLKTVTVV